MRRCARCVLTENHPNTRFNQEGVCNYCLEFEKAEQLHRSVVERKDEFVEILEAHRGQGEYDCLMMLSGGKNSVYALYLLREQYKLSVLSFTFDNGFESEAALENVRRVVDVLEVDHLYLRPTHVKRLFRFLLHSGVKPFVLCPLCKSAMNTTAWKMAKKFGIGLIISGDTKGQIVPVRPSYPGMYTQMQKTAVLLTSRKEFRPYFSTYFDTELFRSKTMEKDGVRLVSPFHYMKWDGRTATEVLEMAVGWKAPDVDYPRAATNCLMNLVIAYTARQEYGFSFYDTEMSELIRHGEMTRQEALQALETEIDRDLVDRVLSRLDLSLAQVCPANS